MSYEFSPCYRCGGKVENDFLGRIRCTKCGYDFKTMSVDPDFEPEEVVCEYCNLIPSMDGSFYFGKDLPMDDNGCMYICKDEESSVALCYKDYEDDEHILFIQYCPICGRKLVEDDEI